MALRVRMESQQQGVIESYQSRLIKKDRATFWEATGKSNEHAVRLS